MPCFQISNKYVICIVLSRYNPHFRDNQLASLLQIILHLTYNLNCHLISSGAKGVYLTLIQLRESKITIVITAMMEILVKVALAGIFASNYVKLGIYTKAAIQIFYEPVTFDEKIAFYWWTFARYVYKNLLQLRKRFFFLYYFNAALQRIYYNNLNLNKDKLKL